MSDDIIKTVQECRREAQSGWDAWMSEADEDYRMYMGDQWTPHARSLAREKGIPDIDINKIKKQVDSASGFQRQNNFDLKAFPIEGSDEYICDILTASTKWVLMNGNAYSSVSQSYFDACVCGRGWIVIDIDYDRDMINGDVRFKSESPFNILPSPYMIEPDLSDCPYVIRYKILDYRIAQQLYPQYSKEIEGLKSTVINDDGVRKFVTVPSNKGDQVLVTEYWRREYADKTILFNVLDPSDTTIWTGDDEELRMVQAENPHYSVIKKAFPEIKLTTLIGDALIVYDDVSPIPLSTYPFIPFWGYYIQSFDEWDDKLTGLVRPLKPLQQEKNKRRSSIMQAISTMPYSGFMAERGAVDDVNEFRAAGGASKFITVNRIQGIQPINPPQFPNSLAQLEQMFDGDFDQIGLNLSLIGQIATDRESASLYNMRRQQGLASIQELNDRLSDSLGQMGRCVIELIGKQFGPEKIQKIVGQEMQVPQDIDRQVNSAQYDCKVDLIANSPTHRYSVQQQIKELQQYGIPIPPQLAIEYLDIPAEVKQKVLDWVQNQQAAMTAEQQPQSKAPAQNTGENPGAMIN